ncbi:MAG: hypothetical protein AAF518_06525 [Spirochaetota bacterium]
MQNLSKWSKGIAVVLLTLSMFVACSNNKKKNELSITEIFLLFLIVETTPRGSCEISFSGGRTAYANPVTISSTATSIPYTKVPIVSHTIGTASLEGIAAGDVFEFTGSDVADFDQSNSTSTTDPETDNNAPLVYSKATCPLTGSDVAATSAYTRVNNGDGTWTYTFNEAGDYSFVVYQLTTSPVTTTVRKTN